MKALYYIIQWTWGIIMNVIGLIAFIVAKCCKCETYQYRNAICIVVPWNFGGLELGMFFVRGENNASVCPHEYGHSIQNLWWGPLFPFVIALPSAFRYWMRTKDSNETKSKFALSVYLVLELIVSIIIVLGFIFVWPTIIIIGILIAIYGIILGSWMLCFEIPKYKNIVKYDDIWFEGQATALGTAANQNKWTWL